jgi:AcrR family transcriptional regulator
MGTMTSLRERQKIERQLKIVNAATECFLEMDYDSVTVEDIANRAGISAMTIYSYYKTKGGLLLAVVLQSEQKMKEKITKIARSPGDSATEAAIRICNAMSDHALSYLNRDIWRQVIASSYLEAETEFGESYVSSEDQLVEIMADMLRELRRNERVSSDLADDEIAEMLYSVYNSRFFQFIRDKRLSRRQLDRLVARDLTVVMKSISANRVPA